MAMTMLDGLGMLVTRRILSAERIETRHQVKGEGEGWDQGEGERGCELQCNSDACCGWLARFAGEVDTRICMQKQTGQKETRPSEPNADVRMMLMCVS